MGACVVVDVVHSHHQKTKKNRAAPSTVRMSRRFMFSPRLCGNVDVGLWKFNEMRLRGASHSARRMQWGFFLLQHHKIIPLFSSSSFIMLPYGSCRHTASGAQNREKSSRSQQPRLKFNNFSLVWRHPAQAQEADEWKELQSILVVMDRREAKRLARWGQQNTTITMNLCGRFNQSSLWESHFSH